MAYRKFYLENSLGEKYQLTDKNFKQYLNNPEGFGFSKTLTTLRLGNDELFLDEQYTMPSVSGSIIFYNRREQAYQDYYDFIKFVRYTPLKLYYLPPHLLSPYFIECYITDLDKGEYSNNGYLDCSVTFYGNTLWQNSQESLLTVNNSEDSDGKYYDLVRPYHYGGYSLSNITINNIGDIPIGFELEILGDVTNPRITAKQNGKTFGLLKLTGSFDYAKVDSNDLTESIYLEQNGVMVSNPLSYQDLNIADGTAAVTFFKLQVGENNLAFSCDNLSSFDGQVSFKWKDKRISI